MADQLGIQRETLRRWVTQDEVEYGTRPGLTKDDGTVALLREALTLWSERVAG